MLNVTLLKLKLTSMNLNLAPLLLNVDTLSSTKTVRRHLKNLDSLKSVLKPSPLRRTNKTALPGNSKKRLIP